MRYWIARALTSLAGAALLAGCPSTGLLVDEDDTGGGDDDTGSDTGCDRYNTLGGFSVDVNRNGGTFSGVYLDGPDPGILDPVFEDGVCVLYRYVPRECDPPCDPPLTCAFDETCRPWPSYVSVGTVSVTGTDPPLQVAPTEYNVYYTQEVYEGLFGPGDHLTVSASGSADVEPFEVTVAGVPLLEPYEQTVTMVEGEPLEITWEVADGPDDAVVRVHLDNDHHGISAYLECEAPSSAGHIVVSEAAVQEMIDVGASGIGTYVENAYLIRYTSHVQQHDPGCLAVYSSSSSWLYVETELR